MPSLGEDNRLPTHAKARAFLENFAKRRIPITYQELAKALQILPPHSIHQVTEALERLMEEDVAADRPLIAALAISKARGGLPAPGFFDCARRLGRFARQLTTTISCSPKSIRPLAEVADCPDLSPITTGSVDVRHRPSEVQERPRRP